MYRSPDWEHLNDLTVNSTAGVWRVRTLRAGSQAWPKHPDYAWFSDCASSHCASRSTFHPQLALRKRTALAYLL